MEAPLRGTHTNPSNTHSHLTAGRRSSTAWAEPTTSTPTTSRHEVYSSTAVTAARQEEETHVAIRAPSGFKRGLASCDTDTPAQLRATQEDVWARRRDSAIHKAATSPNLALSRRHQLREIKSTLASADSTTTARDGLSAGKPTTTRDPPILRTRVDFEVTLPTRNPEPSTDDNAPPHDKARLRSTSAPVNPKAMRVRTFPALKRRVGAGTPSPIASSPAPVGATTAIPWGAGAGHKSRGQTDVRERRETMQAAVLDIEYPKQAPKVVKRKPQTMRREKVGLFEMNEPVVGWQIDGVVAEFSREDWDVKPEEEVERKPLSLTPKTRKSERLMQLQEQKMREERRLEQEPFATPMRQVWTATDEEKGMVQDLILTLTGLVAEQPGKTVFVDERIELSSDAETASQGDGESDNSLPPWVAHSRSASSEDVVGDGSSCAGDRPASPAADSPSQPQSPQQDRERVKARPPPQVLYTLPPGADSPVRVVPTKTKPDAPPVVMRWVRS